MTSRRYTYDGRDHIPQLRRAARHRVISASCWPGADRALSGTISERGTSMERKWRSPDGVGVTGESLRHRPRRHSTATLLGVPLSHPMAPRTSLSIRDDQCARTGRRRSRSPVPALPIPSHAHGSPSVIVCSGTACRSKARLSDRQARSPRRRPALAPSCSGRLTGRHKSSSVDANFNVTSPSSARSPSPCPTGYCHRRKADRVSAASPSRRRSAAARIRRRKPRPGARPAPSNVMPSWRWIPFSMMRCW